MALMIALSLPGSSRLIPYIYDIAGFYVNAASTGSDRLPVEASVALTKLGAPPTKYASQAFSVDYPQWAEQRQRRAAAQAAGASGTHVAHQRVAAPAAREPGPGDPGAAAASTTTSLQGVRRPNCRPVLPSAHCCVSQQKPNRQVLTTSGDDILACSAPQSGCLSRGPSACTLSCCQELESPLSHNSGPGPCASLIVIRVSACWRPALALSITLQSVLDRCGGTT